MSCYGEGEWQNKRVKERIKPQTIFRDGQEGDITGRMGKNTFKCRLLAQSGL